MLARGCMLLCSLLLIPFILKAEQTTTALPAETITQVNAIIDADSARLVALFKDLHQHPELAFLEQRTAKIVADELKKLGFTVTEGIAKTGVIGVLKNGSGPVIWYRADMDANAVKEETGLPYASTQKQRLPDGSEVDVMHACGHDAHVTWLLGMAKAMVELKQHWSGTLVVYAQPAEETGEGAQAMVSDNLWSRGFPKPDYALGAHTIPGPVGAIASAGGIRMAGMDTLDVTFYGKGGHGSSPHLTLDPVVMAAQAVLAYQTIISRNIDPQAAAVLTVGSIEAGRDNNVIPETATVKINLRWFDQATREKLLKRIDEVNQGIAILSGVPNDKMPKKEMKSTADPINNDTKLIETINPSLKTLLGEQQVVKQFPAVMGSEDFAEAFKSLKTPYGYLFIGVAPAEVFAAARKQGRDVPYSNHSANFFVDLAAIPIGAKVATVSVLSALTLSK